MEIGREKGIWEKMVQHSLDMICTIDREGNFTHVSNACTSILGYKSDEMEGRQFIDFVHPKHRRSTTKITRQILKGLKTTSFENCYIHKAGKTVPLSWSAVWSDEDEICYCVARDATELLHTRQKLHQKEELHLALVEHGTDMLAMLDQEGNFIYSGGSTLRAIGYEHEALVGKNAFSLIHPEDVGKAQESLLLILNSKEILTLSDFRFKAGDGEWRWLETTVSNQLDNPSVGALVINSRDITERKNYQLQLEESKQRYQALFQHNPDIILYQNLQGIIIAVNPALKEVFNLHDEDLLDKTTDLFLKKEHKEAHKRVLENIILHKRPAILEVEVYYEGLGHKNLNLTKIPVIVNEEVTGIYTIAKDITESKNSFLTIQQQARKLNTIFESITDAFFTVDKDWKITYLNSEFERLMRVNRAESIGKSIWSLFSDEVDGEIYRQYHLAVDTDQAVHFDAYLARLDMWLQIKAFPSEEGLSVYFDNVTEKVHTRLELEKLSLVASKINNGVVIMDANGVTEWVNKGFTDMMGYTLTEVVGKKPSFFLHGPETDKAVSKQITRKRKKATPFTEEILNYTKSGEKLWLSLDVTPVLNESGKLTWTIFIVTDITFRKQAEESQQQMTKDLYIQNRDLQQFTYIVSHNLRAPLANASGLVDLLNTVEKDSDFYKTCLTNLKTSISRLDTVLTDLNMILSIRDNKDTFDKELVNVSDVCEQALSSLRESLEMCGGEVITNIGQGIAARGNKAYLYSVFYNLLTNAIKYRSPERELKIEIQCSETPQKGIVLSFADNGSGLDLNKVGDNIFRLYKRFHRHAEGRGIGLFLVKTHIEAMGGQIEVASQVNVGTKFVIYLQ